MASEHARWEFECRLSLSSSNGRDLQLIGLSGYSKEGLPVFALGVCLGSFEKASLSIQCLKTIML